MIMRARPFQNFGCVALCILLLIVNSICTNAQVQVQGIIADGISHKPLPFATIKPDGGERAFISGISGNFSFVTSSGTNKLLVSYISYTPTVIDLSNFRNNDTVFLFPSASTLGEVVVRPHVEKIRNIINAAVRNKSLHNPEMYELYQCNVYYKMKADIFPTDKAIRDSAQFNKLAKGREKTYSKDKVRDTTNRKSMIGDDNHIVFSETFSKRMYKRPQQLQEIVIASRFSGLKKTYFTNLVTDVLPFHVYSDYISLNGKDYINPISKGWQQRYSFRLADEIYNENDTTYILSFSPKKNIDFNSLKGLVYINSDGYAISHFISTTGDTTSDREIRIEQVYEKINGKWFPKELNYDLIYKQYVTPLWKLQINGHSLIDSVSFTPGADFKIEKAYSVKLGDSVDKHTDNEWQRLRMDTITTKETNTYHIMDSLFEKRKIESKLANLGKLAIGRYSYKNVDIDITRLLAGNDYENLRIGLGVYTNDKLSKYFELGGWGGYGFGDSKFKFGISATGFWKGNRDNWLRLFYNDDYKNAGNIHIHHDVDREGYRTWLLTTPDREREYGITGHAQKNYWSIELDARKKRVNALYQNNFMFLGKNYSDFRVNEAGIGLRYAYGEKRAPVFGYYFSAGTKYPIVYLRTAYGTINSGNDYSVRFLRMLFAGSFRKHINRWGHDNYRIEAGFIHAFNGMPLSRSFLLAAKGFKRDGINYYALGGFLTMRPYDYYSDGYVSLLYKHDFDKYLWQSRFSKPFLSVIHNFMIGNLSNTNKTATPDIKAPVSGYHESGIIFNQLLQKDLFHSFYIYLNAGVIYHWTSSFNWNKNKVWIVGISAGF